MGLVFRVIFLARCLVTRVPAKIRYDPQGSLIPRLQNMNVEVVQVWRTWYFSHVKSVKGRREIHIRVPGEPGNEATPGRAPHAAAEGLGMRLGKRFGS